MELKHVLSSMREACDILQRVATVDGYHDHDLAMARARMHSATEAIAEAVKQLRVYENANTVVQAL